VDSGDWTIVLAEAYGAAFLHEQDHYYFGKNFQEDVLSPRKREK